MTINAPQAAARIREALEAGPTGLAWIVTSAADIFPEGGNYLIASCGGKSGLYRNYAANSRYIAACSPDALRAILDRMDELAKDAATLREALTEARKVVATLAGAGQLNPYGVLGQYSKDAFLTLRTIDAALTPKD